MCLGLNLLARALGRLSLEPVMSFNQSLCRVAITVLALAGATSMIAAQPGSFGGGYGPPLKVVAPPSVFKTSDEH